MSSNITPVEFKGIDTAGQFVSAISDLRQSMEGEEQHYKEAQAAYQKLKGISYEDVAKMAAVPGSPDAAVATGALEIATEGKLLMGDYPNRVGDNIQEYVTELDRSGKGRDYNIVVTLKPRVGLAQGSGVIYFLPTDQKQTLEEIREGILSVNREIHNQAVTSGRIKGKPI